MSDYVPTIDDLRVKLCFICREEEYYDNQTDPPRKWTHPCQCTLLAHEDCLLEWIKTAQTSPSSTAAEKALKCPQCGASYQLESDLPVGMKIMNEALTKLNMSLGTLGKWFIVLVPLGLATGIAIGTHFVLTRYGAYAVREFFGDEVFDALLTSDPSNWPWTALINLPLIPIGLISYRFKPTYNLFPVISTLLEWPTFQKRRVYGMKPSNSANILSWPPSPFTVGFIVLPLTRYLYRQCLARFTLWALEVKPRRSSGLEITDNLVNAAGHRAGIIAGDEVEEDRMFMVRFRPGEGGEGAEGADAGAGEGNEGNRNPGNEGGASISVNASPLGRKVGGALLVPFIAKRMGNLLLRLSKHSELLRRFLAVRTPGRISSVLTPSLGRARQGEVTLGLVMRTLWGGGQGWAEFDTVWWRNTLGFGLFVVAKDAIHLLHLYLVKKEIESRRVKNRDFRDVDMSGLDVIPRGETR
ncbi:hypothetical protein L218DRAFT_926301 [Marasmius fiardii PR-910]|nr:hypothetical protein L218DRAFT_926301 [Marasmius fiardii PR-910]